MHASNVSGSISDTALGQSSQLIFWFISQPFLTSIADFFRTAPACVSEVFVTSTASF
jgi:hypothetical protein